MFDLANATLSDMNWPSVPTHVSLDQLSTLPFSKDTIVFAWDLVKDQLVLSNIWKIILVLHIVANFKNFPLVYHLRILNAVRFVLRSQRPQQDVRPEQLFQPLITSSKACLTEIDVYGHKSNSTYFADVDIARAHLVTTLFGKGIAKIRGNTTMNGLNGSSSNFTMALGGVSCSFKKELRPYETYDMWTRLLSWDEKWIYMVTHFVKKGANITPREYTLYPRQKSLGSAIASRQGSLAASIANTPRGSTAGIAGTTQSSPIAASALSKIVFKEGRKTIAPSVILELSGLLPPRAKEEKAYDLATAQDPSNLRKVSSRESISPLQKVEASDGENDSDLSRRSSFDGKMNEWTRDKIEAERLRGLKMAQLLSKQTALEDEFVDDAALGRHYDGFGIEGVVSTLAQLGGFSKYQLL